MQDNFDSHNDKVSHHFQWRRLGDRDLVKSDMVIIINGM